MIKLDKVNAKKDTLNDTLNSLQIKMLNESNENIIAWFAYSLKEKIECRNSAFIMV